MIVSQRAELEPVSFRQGGLFGKSVALDRRSYIVRDDLADAALARQIMVPRYAEAVQRQCVVAIAMICASPGGRASSALLFGEHFEVFEFANGWAWGRGLQDGYVGYVPAQALGLVGLSATHRVSVASALVFSEPDIKSPVNMQLAFNARFVASSQDERFLTISEGFIHVRHARKIGERWDDMLTAAEIFLGSPYLWGGRTPMGVDCSGLVQAAMFAAGLACPRDSDQQLQALGEPVDFAARTRGDLLIWPGHIGILVEDDRLLHANAFWMRTVTEPVADAIARVATQPQLRRL